MDEVELFARRFRPKLLVCGASAYSRHIDFAHFRKIADEIGALLLCDMAHISGLVAGGAHPSPFPHVDIVTTTTHKSLRGPRGSMIFFRKGEKGKDADGKPVMYDLESRINESVFPGHQGGPHNHTIAALAVALKQAQAPHFKEYQSQVVKNSKALCEALQGLGHEIVSGGTDNHLVLINLKAKGVNGAKAETICDLVNNLHLRHRYDLLNDLHLWHLHDLLNHLRLNPRHLPHDFLDLHPRHVPHHLLHLHLRHLHDLLNLLDLNAGHVPHDFLDLYPGHVPHDFLDLHLRNLDDLFHLLNLRHLHDFFDHLRFDP